MNTRKENAQPPARESLLIARRPFRVGRCRVDLALNEIVREGRAVHIAPRCAAVLELLVHHAGQAVSKEHFLADVWRDESPGEDAVAQAIVELRRALGDNARLPDYIRTVPRVGYALIAPVEALENAPSETTVGDAAAFFGRCGWGVRMAAGSMALAAVGVMLAAGYLLHQAPEHRPGGATTAPEPPARLTPRLVTAELGRQGYPSLSPDASAVVYATRSGDSGRSVLVVRSLQGGAPMILRAADDVEFTHPAWSPDGSTIAYRACSADLCAIEITPFTGGTVKRLMDDSAGPMHPFDWTADAQALVLSSLPQPDNPMGLPRLLDLASGETWLLEDGRQEPSSSVDPRMSPDGRFVAFRRGGALDAGIEGTAGSALMLLDLTDGTARELDVSMSSIAGHAWTNDGEQLLIASRHSGRPALYLYHLAEQKVLPLHLEEVRSPRMAARASWLTYEVLRVRQQLVGIATQEYSAKRPDLTPASTASDRQGALAPYSGRLAFISDRSGRDQIWIAEADGSHLFAATAFVDGLLADMCWAADESRMLVLRQIPGGSELVELAADSWQPRSLLQRRMDARDLTCSEDPDLAHVLVRDGQDAWQVMRVVRRGTEWDMQSTGQHAWSLRRDAARGHLFALNGPRGDVLRLTREGFTATAVALDVPYLDWAVHDGLVFVVVNSHRGGSELVEMTQSGDHRTVARIPFSLPGHLRMDLSADGTLVIPRVVADDSDIAVVALPDPAGPDGPFSLVCGSVGEDGHGQAGAYTCRSTPAQARP